MVKSLNFVAIARSVIKECKRGLSDGIKDDEGHVCVMAAIEIAMGESKRDDDEDEIGASPSCVHSELRYLGIELNDGSAWYDEKERGKGMVAYAVACLNTARCKNLKPFWEAFHIEYTRLVVPVVVKSSGDAPALWKYAEPHVRSIKTVNEANDIMRGLIDMDGSFGSMFDKDFPFASIAEDTSDSNAVMKATCQAATTALKGWRKESAKLLQACKLK